MNSNGQRVIWEPTPKQAEFLSCPARETLFGGAAGGGKSFGLLAGALSQVKNPLHRAILIRRSYPQLKDLIAASFELYKPLGAEFNKVEKTWTFPSGAQIEFGFLDSPEDRFSFQGRQFSFLGFDELGQLPGDGMDGNGEPVNVGYLYLISRLRSPEGSGLRHEIRSATNPGGVGHSWIKQRWNIPDDGGPSERRDPKTNFRRVFIPARLTDNPYLANTDYARGLDALALADQKTLKHGRWDVFEGAVFSEWDYSKHTCEVFPIPEEWPMWRGCDDGYASPACVLWAALDEIYDRLYIVNEIYARGLTPLSLADLVLKIDKFYGGGSITGVIDSASFADTGFSGGGRANIMNAHGCGWIPAEKGTDSRLAGKAAIHSRLALRDDGLPGLIVFRTCRNLVRTLPALPYSSTHPEDVDTDAEDHCYDCLRYLLTKREFHFRRVRVRGL